jgi:hypothetical protein
MAQGFGYESWIGVGVESTYGTAVARSKFFELASESIKFKTGRTPKPSLRGLSADRVVPVKEGVDGSFEIQFPYSGAEVLLKHAMGAVNTSGSSPYTHEFTLADSLPVGLSVEVNRAAALIGGSSSFLYEGCQIAKWSLKQSAEEFLMFSADIVGEDSSNVAASSPTFATWDGAHWGEVNNISLNSTTHISRIESFELNVDNALATDRYRLGSRLRKGLGRSGPREVTGSITAEFDALTLTDLYRNETAFPIEIAYLGSGGAGMTITLPNCRLEGDDPGVESSGPIKLTLNFRAYQSAAANDELAIELINEVSSVP